MSFEEIDDVVRTLEYSPYGPEIDTPQPFQPNMYKTHLTYEECPKGFDKYIIVTRFAYSPSCISLQGFVFSEPKDAAVSNYTYLCNWFFTSEEIGLNEFTDYFVASEIPEKYSKYAAIQLRHQGEINSIESQLRMRFGLQRLGIRIAKIRTSCGCTTKI